jgi:predicted phosphate transport protein (TIGR00153 family)
MKLLSVLMPRERHFFTLFNRHASLVVQGSKTLIDLLSAYENEAQREQLIGKIQSIEKAADEVTRETVGLMHTTFVTPFDRDQINRLISRMDDILDLIQDTAESMTLYDIRRITPEAAHLGNLVDLCAGRVQVAVGLLSSMDNGPEILKVCQEIDVLESDADRVMRGAVSRLFREEADVRELIKLKAVYELLETTTDRCHDVGKVIEGVVLENG